MKPLRHVFSVVADCHSPSGHYQSLWQRHFYAGLRAVVQRLVLPEAIDFGWARQIQPGEVAGLDAPRDRTSEQLAAQISRAHAAHGLDAVISYCFGHDLNPELVRGVIGQGVPWINFFCDSTHRFGEVAALAQVVSLNWFVEHAAIPDYRALGVPWACLPYAFNPDYLPDCACHTAQRPAAFIGMPTGPRVTQLGWLREASCEFEIRGPGWEEERAGTDPGSPDQTRRAMVFHGLGDHLREQPHWSVVQALARGPLSDEAMPEYLRGCQTVLGLNQGRDALGRVTSYLKLRDLEFPGHGCCYVTEHNDDVSSALDVGREVLTYRTMEEAADLLKGLSHEPARAEQIGRAGRRRVLAEHTWATRIGQLAAAL